MSLPKQLSHATLEKIIKRLNLKEILAENGESYRKTVTKKKFPFGEFDVFVDIRIFKGNGVSDVVYAGIACPPMVDSHMIFAFTPEHSAVPHFTLDSVASSIAGQDIFAYHLDLVPRLDLGANLQYMYDVYSSRDRLVACG